MCNDLRTRRIDHALVSTGMVAVFMRIQDLRNLPAAIIRHLQALLIVERIDCQRVSGFGARDQVVEITI